MTRREWLAWLLLSLVLSLGASQLVRAQRGDDMAIAARYQPAAGLPFEQAGENFPGSAFYYLDDDGAFAVPIPAVLTSDGGNLGLGEPSRSLIARGSIVDRSRALQCLTAAIYYEAAMEPDAGQQAVAQVVLNRLMHPSYPNTVCGVVYQGSERSTGCQFTFSCDGAMARAPSTVFWQRARRVAERALTGYVYAPVGTATHYHTTEVSPYWAPSLDFIGTIGAHRFYRWQGAAGRRAAFVQAHVGNEPFPGPKPRSLVVAAGAADALDPLTLARTYEAARLRAEAET
ncbi:cell wall hydrolase, partial [Blastomonas sp.]|uniref:cell wall hydrolase n=1 Tax=Blastomonas sp. TaxID=1909299 RepID=UPI0035931293